MTYDANETVAMALRAVATLLLLAAGAMFAIDGLYWLRSGFWRPERLGSLLSDPGSGWVGLRIITDHVRWWPLHGTMAAIGFALLSVATVCEN